MIGALFTGAAVEGGLKLSRGLIAGLAFAVLFAACGIGFWRGMAAIERMVERAEKTGADRQDAH
jgi:hypothetical protein